MLLCIGVSYFFFMGQSLRLDEAQSLWQSSRSPSDIVTLVSQDVHVPLYHEILHFWRFYITDSVAGARALSLLFYVLSIPAMYLLGRRAYGRGVGLFGALLITLSPFMQWYGSEVRMYTLLVLVTILNQYFFLKIFTKGKLLFGSGEYTATWVGYAVTTVVGAFVHYFFFLNLLAQVVFYFLRRDIFPPKALRNFIFTALILVLMVLPWAWYVYGQGQAGFQTPLLPTPTTVNLFSTFSQFLFGFQTDGVNTIFLSLWPITLIFAFLTLRRDVRLTPVTEFLLLSLLVPIIVSFGVSFVVPVFVSRYLIFTAPALFLLLGSLFGSYSPRAANLVQVGLAGVMAVMLVVEIINPATPVKENYREAAQFMSAHATPQDTIVLAAPFTLYPIEYYYRGEAPVTTLPTWDQYAYGPIPPFDAAKLPQQVKQDAGSSQNVWLLLSYDQGYNDTVKSYFDNHYQRLASQSFSPGLNLYEYKVRYDTAPATHATTTQTAFAQ